ncbi:MAG: IS1595 family transposase [Altererythrobacter sp.]
MDITAPRFTDVDAAREHLESLRWPDGPYCPHCGSMNAKRLPPQKRKPTKAHPGGTVRKGVIQCNDCRQQYTVTVGTVFERSKIALNKWVLATFLLCSSKRGMSGHQLARMLGVTQKTAWFMSHRIREAMRPTGGEPPLGGEGKTVEADETFIGGKQKNKHKSKRAKTRLGGNWGKQTVFTLVERDGSVRSTHVQSVTAANLRPILLEQVDKATTLCTDDAGQYRHMNRDFTHEVVNHGKDEYVRGPFHTNTVEGYFSILKRGVTGTYYHLSEAHLHRYCTEFDFRYNTRKDNDFERCEKALKGVTGKRLTYRRIG